jgi:hypothetical protein
MIFIATGSLRATLLNLEKINSILISGVFSPQMSWLL